MNTKNYFLTSGVINLLFGISLVFLPGMMIDQYLTDPSLRSSVTDFICKLYGVVLLALSIGLISASSAGPSPARKALLLTGFVADWGTAIVHIIAINEGLQKSFAWGTVLLLFLIGVWALFLLRSNK